MPNHLWVVEIVDGGSVGTEEFFHCTGCGACGGPVGYGDPPRTEPGRNAFFPGPGLPLPETCEGSRPIIRAYRDTLEFQAHRLDNYVWYGHSLLRHMRSHFGTDGQVEKATGGVYIGLPDPNDTTTNKAAAWLNMKPDDLDRADDAGWTLRTSCRGSAVQTSVALDYNAMVRALVKFFSSVPA